MNDYKKLTIEMDFCIKNTKFCKFVVGKTFLGQNIYGFHKGSYLDKQMLITGGIHAREYISSFVVLKLMQEYDLPFGCYFVPAINLDGIGLCCCGLDFVKDCDIRDMLKRLNNNSTNFKLWKANVVGVDLNNNFDAGFNKSRFAKNLPSESGFAGEAACSEKETRAMVRFVKQHNIDYSVAYHSKGNVVYYGYRELCDKVLKKEKSMASSFARTLNYKKIRSLGSTGGLGDYLGLIYGIPSITVELGADQLQHPISYNNFESIYKNQYKALKKFMEKNFG